VQQQPALDVAAAGTQRLAVAGEACGVALDALERRLREHDPVARDPRQGADRHGCRPEGVPAAEGHVVVRDEVLVDHLEPGGIDAEVVAHAAAQHALRLRGVALRPDGEVLDRGGELLRVHGEPDPTASARRYQRSCTCARTWRS
jgi:hypothetical protein